MAPSLEMGKRGVLCKDCDSSLCLPDCVCEFCVHAVVVYCLVFSLVASPCFNCDVRLNCRRVPGREVLVGRVSDCIYELCCAPPAFFCVCVRRVCPCALGVAVRSFSVLSVLVLRNEFASEPYTH